MSKQAAEKARIVEAAYRCLADSDGMTVSITDILTTANLSTRAFYRHFGSKDDLLLTMFRQDAEAVLGELRAIAAAAPTPVEALRGLIHGLLRLTVEERRRHRVMILTSEEAQRAKGYAAERSRLLAAQEQLITEILYAGQKDGSFPCAAPEPDARSIRAALVQAFEEQLTSPAPPSPAEAAEQVADFSLRALGAPREPAR